MVPGLSGGFLELVGTFSYGFREPPEKGISLYYIYRGVLG